MALDPCHNTFFYYYICLLSNSSQILDTFPNTSFLSAYLQASQREGATHTHAHLGVCVLGNEGLRCGRGSGVCGREGRVDISELC